MATRTFVAYLTAARALKPQETAVRRVLQHYRDLGATVIATYTDVAGQGDRPTLAEAVAHARRTGATLIVARLRDLAGEIEALQGLRRAGLQIIAGDLPGASEATVGVMALLASRKAGNAARNAVRDVMPALIDLWHRTGCLGEIARELNARGIRTRRGAEWNPLRVVRAIEDARAEADRVLT